jgi:serine/threonine protein phosphatase PrpC
MAAASPNKISVLSERDLDVPQLTGFAGGQIALFSRRCPGRETVNQDSAAAAETPGRSGLLMIADGVGGMQSGHHASAVAVESVCSQLDRYTGDPQQLRSPVLDGFEEANRRICALGVNAATTLAVVEVHENRIRPYHVGDSMILLCGQRGRLHWQSISHSPVGYAVESGLMDESDAMSHPDRHFVSNIVGCAEMRIEVGPSLTMGARDTLLLCSDGLSDNLSTDEIVSVVRCGDLLQAVQKLVDLATARMCLPQGQTEQPSKPDDLTIIAFRRTPHETPPEHSAPLETDLPECSPEPA